MVTAVNQDLLSRDSYTVQPIARLGHSYHVMSYWPSSLHTQFAITAIADGTRVSIDFVRDIRVSVRLNGQILSNGKEFEIRRYETLQVQVHLCDFLAS